MNPFECFSTKMLFKLPMPCNGYLTTNEIYVLSGKNSPFACPFV